MANTGASDTTPGAGRAPTRRPRAPTITIDTSAASEQADNTSEHKPALLSDQNSRSSLEFSPMHADHSRNASFESRESRPTSPHNVSSPTAAFTTNNNLLSVPLQRKRGGSVDTEDSVSTADSTTFIGSEQHRDVGNTQSLGAGDHPVLPDSEALHADPGTEADFQRENNPFAFTPGQLGKLLNPKSLGAFHALGGPQGLERGLRSSIKDGLSPDEHKLEGEVSFEDATSQSLSKASQPSAQEASRIEKASEASNSFEDRKRIFGDNILPERKSKTIFELIWIAYNDKILILLTVAAVIALALGIYQSTQPPQPGEGPSVEWVEGVAIIVAIVVVTSVGALNDWQKERQFVKLNKKKEDRDVKVIRAGTTQEISIHDILVGDLLLVEPGDILPVDGIFISGHSVRCDESSATGESDILKKTNADEVYSAMEAGRPLKKLDPFMISGAKVTEGFGRMLVTSTGVHSSHGKTMLSLREENEATPLQMKLNKMAEYIAKLGSAAALLLFIVLLIKFLANLRYDSSSPAEKGRHFVEIFITAVVIVVVAVPEGLPLAVTLALAYATKRMLKDNNLVRVLRSCETMGNATSICSDKTGTLTQNVMTVVAGCVGTSNRFNNRAEDGVEHVGASECVKALAQDVRALLKESIAINSTAFEGLEDGKQTFVGSKTETALLSFARDYLAMDKVSVERSNVESVQVVPFDSSRKCMAVVIKLQNGTYRLLVKGASEIMLEKCTNIVRDPTQGVATTTIDDSMQGVLSNLIDSYASRSLRTLGLIYRDFQEWPPRHARRLEDDKTQAVFEDVCKHMTFLGLFGIQDPLRPGVAESVQDCLLAGVFPRMVTGDNIVTAKAIAKECGILTANGAAIEGPVFRKMSKAEQLKLIPKLQVMARSSPDDKRILVKRLKEMGETVAVTGDGTNDAPALKAADVGFSMNIAGTEVAKEASDIILMDDNFTSIVKALMWGRAVNDAVQKFLQFQITVNITAVLLAFISAVSSPGGESVLKAVQLLWVNLIMDTMAALALATDPPSRAILNRKPDPKSAPLITVTMWKMIIGQAIYQLVVTLILYFAGAKIFQYDNPTELASLSTMIFNSFVWMQIFNALNNRRLDNRFNVFEGMSKNYFFIGIWLIMIGGQILIVFVGGDAFQIETQTADQWGVAIVLGALSIPIGVVIRLIPNELIMKLIPEPVKRWASSKNKDKIIITDEENPFQFNQALMDIREELGFIKKYKGGRLRNLKFKMANPKEILHSRSPSRSRTSLSYPSTPQRTSTDVDHMASPPSTKRRGRDRSNSTIVGAAMAGIIAGSIGGWSPIDRTHPEFGSLPYGHRSRNVSKDFGEPIEMRQDASATRVVVSDMSDDKAPTQTTEKTPDSGKKDELSAKKEDDLAP
ncbi:hypothetical protein AMS68_007219 [Peltaster fructicola]|uniref:Calcium-transporting ATPase n=1 Tax=Peltaster fructicola TaxID=286661 RepID=A0A6H0Y3U9_9PEZI|nr:hypothetical protein AMS68_007219 [Peltaster fructicola]